MQEKAKCKQGKDVKKFLGDEKLCFKEKEMTEKSDGHLRVPFVSCCVAVARTTCAPDCCIPHLVEQFCEVGHKNMHVLSYFLREWTDLSWIGVGAAPSLPLGIVFMRTSPSCLVAHRMWSEHSCGLGDESVASAALIARSVDEQHPRRFCSSPDSTSLLKYLSCLVTCAQIVRNHPSVPDRRNRNIESYLIMAGATLTCAPKEVKKNTILTLSSP
jgi:hypothetical protein